MLQQKIINIVFELWFSDFWNRSTDNCATATAQSCIGGRAVASDVRGSPFQSSHMQILVTLNWIEKTKIENEAGNGPF